MRMKNILLAVCGLSPQVITETLFAIHQSGRKVDAIHIITTREGKERIFADLLAEKSGHYYRYLAEYGSGPYEISFDASTIHTVSRHGGREISDITDERDSEALLRKCLELTFDLTRNPETAVFFSVAGGRKTMSACLTLAAQMYGLPQDRI
ncbi:MAG: TIGR02584 family CRISPR-associated protein, partial [Desulfobacterales bacterium CG23_combo_of_CG06-09_8_20_14_all_52_9]